MDSQKPSSKPLYKLVDDAYFARYIKNLEKLVEAGRREKPTTQVRESYTSGGKTYHEVTLTRGRIWETHAASLACYKKFGKEFDALPAAERLRLHAIEFARITKEEEDVQLQISRTIPRHANARRNSRGKQRRNNHNKSRNRANSGSGVDNSK